MQLLLLERDLLDLFGVTQDGLLGQLAQPALEIVVLRLELSVLLVASDEVIVGRNRFLRHRLLLLRSVGRPRVGFRRASSGGDWSLPPGGR
jgi:hypothetical protein